MVCNALGPEQAPLDFFDQSHFLGRNIKLKRLVKSFYGQFLRSESTEMDLKALSPACLTVGQRGSALRDAFLS